MYEELGYVIPDPVKLSHLWPIKAKHLRKMTLVLHKNCELAFWLPNQDQLKGWATIFRICTLAGMKQRPEFFVGEVTVLLEDIQYITIPDIHEVQRQLRNQLNNIKITNNINNLTTVID